MDETKKQRAVGAVVLIALAVIIVPMFMDFGGDKNAANDAGSVVPPKPQGALQTINIPLQDNKLAADMIPPADVSAEQLLSDVTDRPPAKGRDNAAVLMDAPAASNGKNTSAAPAGKASAQPATQIAKAAPAPTAKIPEPKPQLASGANHAKGWAVQVGSFGKKENAEKLQTKLRKAGYKAFISSVSAEGKTVVRVRIGPELQRTAADQLKSKVERELQLQAKVVEYP